MNEYYNSTYLRHHGIKGMHWGVRRYQYEDGSWTPAGADRYGEGTGQKHKMSFKAGANKLRAKIHGMNEKVYAKSNKTLSSMNRAAKEQYLAKAKEAQKAADDRANAKIAAKQHQIEDRRQHLSAKAMAKEERLANEGAKLAANGETIKKNNKRIVNAAVSNVVGKTALSAAVSFVGTTMVARGTLTPEKERALKAVKNYGNIMINVGTAAAIGSSIAKDKKLRAYKRSQQ